MYVQSCFDIGQYVNIFQLCLSYVMLLDCLNTASRYVLKNCVALVFVWGLLKHIDDVGLKADVKNLFVMPLQFICTLCSFSGKNGLKS